MEVNNQTQAEGVVHLLLLDEHGSVKQEVTDGNLVVQTGLNFLANALAAVSSTPFGYMAVGTGTNAAALGDTTLQTELYRHAVDSATPSSNVTTFVMTMGPGIATGALTEAGIFNAASLGTMLSRIVFAVVNKGSSDTLIITWTLTLSN